MIKRGHIDMGEGIFRVSKPGVDVGVAGDLDFLLHENDLYTQPYFTQFVTWTYGNDTSSTTRSEVVQVTVPDVTDDPIVVLYQRYQPTDLNFFPIMATIGTSGNYVSYEVVSSTRIDVHFYKPPAPWGPRGAYMTLARRPGA